MSNETTEQTAPSDQPVKTDMIAGDEPIRREGMDWFTLRVASNKENSVRETLLRKVQIEKMTHLVGRILVPTEKTKTIKGGKQKIVETKLYPGYVFVEMRLEPDGRIPQDVFFLIKETTGVGDFVGTAGRPTPLREHEIEKLHVDSRRPRKSPSSNSSSRRASTSPSRKAPSRDTRERSTNSSPRRASSESSSPSSAARRRSKSRNGNSPRPGRSSPAPHPHASRRPLLTEPPVCFCSSRSHRARGLRPRPRVARRAARRKRVHRVHPEALPLIHRPPRPDALLVNVT